MASQRWRVEELAQVTGISVDTIRFYQKRRLLPPPTRDGRIVWYGQDHRDRLERIRALQDRGLPLALIDKALDGDADGRLAARVADEASAGLRMTADEIAERTGVPATAIAALGDAGLIGPATGTDPATFPVGDAELVALGRTLLDVGLPLDEVLDLARHYHDVTLGIADRAVDMFARHVRTPIHDGTGTDDEKADRLVAAFDALFPAVTALVSNHFARVLLDRAEAALADDRPRQLQERTA